MPHFDKLVIVGLGLLGGSIGLAAKRWRLARQVWGLGRRPARLRSALGRRIVDVVTTSPKQAFQGADFIVLGTPFRAFQGWLRQARRFAPLNCTITDVGSVKGSWVAGWEQDARPLAFISSHPMAGSEKTGFEYARADLFLGAPCILTPTPRSRARAVRNVAAFWRAVGGRVLLCSPFEHDRLVGRFSHLTHAASFALFLAASRGLRRKHFSMAGPSFWEATRVACSDGAIWADIFEDNHQVLRAEIRALAAALQRIAAVRGGRLRRLLAGISRRARSLRP